MKRSPPTARWLLLALLMFAGSIPAQERTLVVLGDSLSAAYGMAVDRGWVGLLRERLNEQAGDFQVVNASISGETTSGGLARLPGILERHQPDWIILELGGNDGLRGLPLPEMKSNILKMIRLSRRAGAKVLLIGMKLPPNYGPVYTESFEAVYRQIAEETGVAFMPFLLQGVAGDERMMQPDRIHAAPDAQDKLLANVWTVLQPLIAERPVSR
jgi:acyl-CoA thioesterase-1